LGHWADVSKAVNARMAARGLSQRELAERSGVSPATLRKIQHGDEQARNRSTLANISRALGWPEDHLWRVSSDGLDAARLPDDDPASLRRELDELQRRVVAIESRLEMTDAGRQQLQPTAPDAGQVVECSCHRDSPNSPAVQQPAGVYHGCIRLNGVHGEPRPPAPHRAARTMGTSRDGPGAGRP